VSPSLRGTYDRLVEAIHAIRDFSQLPQTLIHNDAYPGNAIVGPDGDAMFIDWHGSGIGPPIVDLAFLLISSEIAPSWSDALIPDRRRDPTQQTVTRYPYPPAGTRYMWRSEMQKARCGCVS